MAWESGHDVSMWERLQKLLDRIESRAALWGVIGGSSVVAVVTGYLSRTVTWINDNLGAFGWWVAALLGALLFAVIFLLIAWARAKLVTVKAVRRWEQQSDEVNPLATEFSQKRIKLSDLANPLVPVIESKRFTDCELLGPANIAVRGSFSAYGAALVDCDIVCVRDNVPLHNVLWMKDTDIVRGKVVRCTFFVPQAAMQSFAQIPGMHAITLTGDAELDSRLPGGRAA